MNVQAFFRTIGFLLILFVVIFIGTENTKETDFYFSLIFDKPLHAPAALVYFAMFAVGVVGGTLLHGSSSKGGGKGGESSSRKK